MNRRMPPACFDVLESQVNKYTSVHECWKLDKLAKCFGVFLVNFCVAKVKETTNTCILASAEQYRRITGNITVL